MGRKGPIKRERIIDYMSTSLVFGMREGELLPYEEERRSRYAPGISKDKALSIVERSKQQKALTYSTTYS